MQHWASKGLHVYRWLALIVCLQIYQSSFALLGHALESEPGHTEPTVDVFLELIRTKLDSSSAAGRTRGNALWALVQAANHQSASKELLLTFVEQLISIFKRTDEFPCCIIYAASAMTSICAPRATDAVVIKVVTRPDVFLHLSGLLRAQFPHTIEKITIFTNVVRMLFPAVNKVHETKFYLPVASCYMNVFSRPY